MEIFSYKVSSNKAIAKCGIEVYRGQSSSIVVVTELPTNPGMSVCNAFEDLFLQLVEAYNLDPASVLWIERWGQWRCSEGAPYNRQTEDWHQVRYELDGKKARNPYWLPVTAEFVAAAKAKLLRS
jgi:hypothetical protein